MVPVTWCWFRRLHLLLVLALCLNLLPPGELFYAHPVQAAPDTLGFPYPLDFPELQPPTQEAADAGPATAPAFAPDATVLQQSGSMDLPLQSGWNLIALPLLPTTTTPAAIFGALGSSYDLVYAYDGCTAGGQWKKYNPTGPPFANTLSNVAMSQGLWVRVQGTPTLTVQGANPSNTSIPLCVGWNLISFPADVPAAVATALQSIAGKYDLVYGYVAGNANPWQKYNPTGPPFANTLSQLQAGRGYWVRMTQAATLVVEETLPPTPLRVDLSATPTSGTVPVVVNFTASIRGDSGDVINYTWDFGDGVTQPASITLGPTGVAVVQLAHTYTVQGNFSAKVTATRNSEIASDQVAITTDQLTSLTSASPADGESGVASTRETILEFSGPLDPATVTDAAFIPTFGGAELAKRIQLSADQRRVTLFYNTVLPGNARVQVLIDGNRLKDSHGANVDVDGNGAAGGVRTIAFDILTMTVLPGTAVCGRVFASELALGDNQSSVNVPLAGATITVDGRESTLRATTDNLGNFCLDPAPAGTFFVHIDGRTATNGVPTGAYYPFVGKTWESTPGQQTNVGDVYLPLVTPGTLQPVSATADTEIRFSPTVLSQHPEFANVKITVPANSLFRDNGTRGGLVGIAPVPPDRLPGALPDGLDFPVVITVQTDGATNFDEPAPVCFPNLPDPNTGQPLAPGAKDALYSFNHDTGQWAAVGSMTVTADGTLVCTDPGVGVIAPGWHGNGPAPIKPPPPPPPPPLLPCRPPNDTGGPPCVPCKDSSGYNMCERSCTNDYEDISKACFDGLTDYGYACGTVPTVIQHPYVARACGIFLISAGLTCKLSPYFSRYTNCEEQCYDRFCPSGSNLTQSPTGIFSVLPINEISSIDPTIEQIQQLSNDALALAQPYIDLNQEIPAETLSQIEALLTQADQIGDGEARAYIQTVINETGSVLSLKGNAPSYSVLYFAQVRRSDGQFFQLRGKTGPSGRYELFIPRLSEILFIAFYDPLTQMYDMIIPNIVDSQVILPKFALQPLGKNLRDFDNDGLQDIVELIYGTNPNNPDTDNDGISDGAEVQNGTDPLGGFIAQTGIIGTADTPGTAVDVCADNNLAVVADSAAGIALFNVFDNRNPRLIAQVDTPGSAQRVACGDQHVAVADGSSGLSIVDISDPANARIFHQVNLGSTATAVAIKDDLAIVGATDDRVRLVQLETGLILSQVTLDGDVHDLRMAGRYLYALTATKLYAIDTQNDQLVLAGNVNVTGVVNGGQLKRLFVGNDVAYVTHRSGYNTYSLANPAQPVLIANGSVNQFGWKQIIANGSGVGVAAAGPNSTGSPSNIWLFDISDPAQTNRFLTQFETPGLAQAAAIYNGLAYIADGASGLQVVNYQAYDTAGTPPTVTFTSDRPNQQVEEGAHMLVNVAATDDVAVRMVELLVNNTVVATDGSYPFHFFVNAPTINTQITFTLSTRATDTGGNKATSTQTFTLLPDNTPPTIVATNPISGWLGFDLTRIGIVFSEAIAPNRLNLAGATLIHLGADGLIGGGDDTPVTLRGTEITFGRYLNFLPTAPLSAGNYHFQLDPSIIADLKGNPLAAPFDFLFSSRVTPPANTVVWIAPGGGDWATAGNWSSNAAPGPNDHVLIDRFPAVLTINHASGTSTIASLVSQENIALTGGTLTVKGASTISGEFTGNRAALQADGADASFTATGSTNLYRLQLKALNGGEIHLPNAVSYDAGEQGIGGQVYLQATGADSIIDLSNVIDLRGDIGWAGSFYVQALQGGQINLSRVPTMTVGNMLVLANGLNSTVNLTALRSLRSVPGFQAQNSSLEVRSSGTIVAPNLTHLDRTNLTLANSGTLATSQFITYTSGSAVIDAATIDLHNVTNADQSNFTLQNGGTVNLNKLTHLYRVGFFVKNGVTLSLPNVVSYDAGEQGINGRVYLQTTGVGSTIDLSNVIDLRGDIGWAGQFLVQALAGGRIDLSSVPTMTIGNMLVLADGSNSQVNLTALQKLRSTPGFQGSNSSLEARNGGAITAPNLLDLNKTNIAVNNSGSLAVSQFITYTAGSAVIDAAAANFTGMRNADYSSFTLQNGGTANLNNLTHLYRVSLFVKDGVTLSLPNVISYNAGEQGINGRVYLQATGAGSTIDLSNVVNLRGDNGWAGQFLVEALQGGQIQLSQVPSMTIGNMLVVADGAGSTVNLGGMYELRSAPGFQGSNSSLEARNSGTLKLVDDSLTLQRTNLVMYSTGAVTGRSVSLKTDGHLSGDGAFPGDVANGGQVSPGRSVGVLTVNGNYTQANDGKLSVEIGGSTVGVNFDQLAVSGSASILGTLTISLINGYTPLIGDEFVILTGTSVSGTFSTVNGLSIGNGKQFAVSYEPTRIVLKVVAQ